MRLIINTASVLKGGGLQVALSFIQELKNIPENEYHLFLSNTVGKQVDRLSFPKNFYFYDLPFRPGAGLKSYVKINRLFRKLEKKIKPDAVFTTTGPSYWRPKAPHLMGYNLPHHIYPESPYLANIPLKRKLRWKMKKAFWVSLFSKQADAFVVQTD